MALTRAIVPDSEDVWGKHRVITEDITLDSSYPTGGYSIAASSLGWSEIRGLLHIGGNSTSGGVVVRWDNVNKKLMAFRGAGVAHTHTLHFQTSAAANAVTAAANQLRTAAAAFDVAGVANSSGEGGVVSTTPADASLAEVSASTNLSTVKVRVVYLGI